MKNEDVRVLQFQETTVNFIPRGLNLIFPNLDKLKIKNCGLKRITREDLVGLEKLRHLYLDGNELTSLPDDLFIDMPNLKWINFGCNKIEFVSSDLLKPIMNELKYADFSKNTKIDKYFYPQLTGSVQSLKDLMKVIDEQCHEPVVGEINDKDLKDNESKNILSVTHQNKLSEGSSNLWLTGEFSDFLIVVNESKEIQVHKCILAAQSAGFSEIFKNDTNATEIKIEDSSVESVEKFLRYLYTGELTSDAENAMEIFALAAKFKVPEIQEITEKIILSTLNETNAYEIFTFAHSHKSDKMKRKSFEEIRKMYPDKNLVESLMDDVHAVKELIELTEKIDEMMKKLNTFEVGGTEKIS